mgnify:CR=1 FL=1
MTVVIFDDDAVQIRLLEIVLEDKGLSFVNWRTCDHNCIPEVVDAIACDWLVPASWEPKKKKLIDLAIKSGVPTAIYTAGGINENILNETYPNSGLELVEKNHGAESIIEWLERKGIKGK